MKKVGFCSLVGILFWAMPAGADDATATNDRIQQGSFSVPAWIISSPPQTQTQQPEQQIIINNPAAANVSPFNPGAFPGFAGGWLGGYGTAYGYGGGPYSYGWNSGLNPWIGNTIYSGIGGWARPWSGLGYGYGGYGGYVPGLGGYLPGLGGYGMPWGGLAGFAGSGLAFGGLGYGTGFGYGGYGYGGFGGYGGFLPGFGGWGWGNPGAGALYMGALGGMGSSNHSMFGNAPTVIDNRPSTPSGNYYAPSTADPTASGGYYSQTGGSVAYPVTMPNPTGPKNYWGPAGNPFPKDIMSTPWSK